jgi:hypothetical protein
LDAARERAKAWLETAAVVTGGRDCEYRLSFQGRIKQLEGGKKRPLATCKALSHHKPLMMDASKDIDDGSSFFPPKDRCVLNHRFLN